MLSITLGLFEILSFMYWVHLFVYSLLYMYMSSHLHSMYHNYILSMCYMSYPIELYMYSYLTLFLQCHNIVSIYIFVPWMHVFESWCVIYTMWYNSFYITAWFVRISSISGIPTVKRDATENVTIISYFSRFCSIFIMYFHPWTYCQCLSFLKRQ